MVIGYLKVEIMIPEARSLKEKRMIIKSIKDQARARFNISIAQLDSHNRWQHAIIGIAAIGNDCSSLNKMMSNFLKWLEMQKSIYIIKHNLSLI